MARLSRPQERATSGVSATLHKARRWRPRPKLLLATLTRLGDEALDALTTPAVMEGIFGSFLIVLGSLTPAFLPRSSAGGGEWERIPVLGTIAVLAGAGLLVDAWFRLHPSRFPVTIKGRRPRFLAVLCLWSAPLVCGPPLFSGDAYAYAAQGWVLAHGLDPYQMGPAGLPSSWADQVDPIWLQTPTPYGPVSLSLQYVTVAVVGDNAYAAAWGMRIWALLGVALLAWCVPRIATALGHDPARAMWLGVLNPIVLFHFVGGSHNDALMMGLVALALWLAIRNHLLVGAIVLGLAAGVKQPAAVAVVALTALALAPRGDEDGPVRAWPTRQQLGWCCVALAVLVATFVVTSLVTGVGFGWIQAMGVPGGAMTLSPATQLGAGLQLLFQYFGWFDVGNAALGVTRTVALVVSGLVIVWLTLRVAHRKPMTSLVASLTALVVGGPALHAWYLLWPGVFAGLIPYRAWIERVCRVLVVFWVLYAVGDFAFRNGNFILAVVAVVCLAAQGIWEEIRRWRSLRESAEVVDLPLN